MSENKLEVVRNPHPSKREYQVRVQSIEPMGSPLFRVFPASNPHYAVREVLAQLGRGGFLPRGWRRLSIEVVR